MTDLPISGLTGATTPLAGTEVLPIVQSGTTKKVSAANVTAGRAVDALSFTATGGTVTASAPVLNATQTWNSGGVTFTGWKLNVTDTASSGSSLLMALQVGGVNKLTVRSDGFLVGAGAAQFSNIYLGASTSGRVDTTGGFAIGASVGSPDVILNRDAANTLALRNGTSAQAFRTYYSYTDASNGDWGEISTGSNQIFIGSNKNGAGVARTLTLMTGGTARWYIDSISGHFTAATDNTYDIGASGANRPRSVYVGTDVHVGNALRFVSFGFIAPSADGVFRLSNAASNGFTRLQFGGTTSSFPAIQRNGATFDFVVADDTNYASVNLGNLISFGIVQVPSGGSYNWASKGKISQTADGVYTFANAAGTQTVTLTAGSSNYAIFGASVALTTGNLYIQSGSSLFLDYGVTNNYGVRKTGTAVRITTGGTVELSDSTGANVAVLTPGASGALTTGGAFSATSLTATGGNVTATGAIVTSSGFLRAVPVTVSSLPAASGANTGARYFVTDALAPTFGSAVVGGGAVKIPVYSDGSTWLVG